MNKKSWLHLLVVLAITAICFIPSLHNEMVHYDDGAYVFDNLAVRTFDGSDLKGILLNIVNPNVHSSDDINLCH